MLIASHNDALVASREQSAMASIISHEPQNHNRYGYRFQVGGTDYIGWEAPLKDEPKIGEPMKVYFDPQNPSENSLTDFADLADTRRGEAIVLLIFCVVFASVVVTFDLTIGKRSAAVLHGPTSPDR
jgi:hypothetical protein